MEKHDFLFWLAAQIKLTPKRRWQIWCFGKTLKDYDRDCFVRKIVLDLKLSPPNLIEISYLKSLPHIDVLNSNYPFKLRQIAQPPLVLFYKGDIKILQSNMMAIVGSRDSSDYAKRIVTSWVPKLVDEGYTTVSGAAKGIDGLVHRVTMSSNGKTVAVLGHGLSHFYPNEHTKLISNIGNDGILISEYPPWVTPKKWHFPARNRIVVGLCSKVWVVEAAEKSGSLVSAQIALDENRQVFCTPGDITRIQSSGSNRLLNDGANMLLSVTDFNGS